VLSINNQIKSIMEKERENSVTTRIEIELGVSRGDAQGIYQAAKMNGVINQCLSIHEQVIEILK
jgi:hypothetical protein